LDILINKLFDYISESLNEHNEMTSQKAATIKNFVAAFFSFFIQLIIMRQHFRRKFAATFKLFS
jgi:hypothetical protein